MEGYTFESWVDEKGDAVDVSVIKGHITVYAKYKAEFAPKYDDLKEMKDSDWYAPAVEYVLTNGIMNGMSDNIFALNTNMSRAMVVTVLHRYVGEPDEDLPKDFENFVDNEDEGRWYYAAVVWAKANEVVNGKDGNRFDPSGNVTREEFVTILYRFAEKIMGEDVGAGKATLSAFADRNDISSWAGSAVKWAYATEDDMNTTGFTPYKKSQYINGKGMKDGKPIMAPKENATRAEVATMLYRYMTGERIPAN